VTLVSGPVCLPKPDGVVVVEIETADEMYRAVMDRVQDHDIYIGAAAVADYSVVEISERKMKKRDVAPQLLLMLTRDILANVTGLEQSPFTVGFAAETDDLEANAKQKLAAKKLDMIVANQVGGEEGGFESDNNALSIFWQGGNIEWGMASKKILAGKLIALVAERYSQWMTLPNK
jgi:phosphopantothenoylcysteine decarboxylase/phosphopantothenate--cysteine ligase